MQGRGTRMSEPWSCSAYCWERGDTIRTTWEGATYLVGGEPEEKGSLGSQVKNKLQDGGMMACF